MQMSVVQPNQQSFWVRRVFPWLSDNQTSWLYDEVGKLGIADEAERLAKEQEIYKQALPIIKQRQDEADRADIQNWRYNTALEEKDPKKKAAGMAEYRISEVADAIKKTKWISTVAPDNEAYTAYLKENPSDAALIENYVNKWDKEILYKMWVEKRPIADKIWNAVKNVWVGIIWWVAWLWAMYAWGKAGKYLSRQLYSAVTPKNAQEIDANAAYKAKETDVKPNKVVDNMLDTPVIQKEGRWTASVWFMWSKTAQYHQAKSYRQGIRKETYDPAFKAMEEKGIKGDYRTLRQTALDNIENSKDLPSSDKRLAKQRINDIFDEHYKRDFGKNPPSMSELNKEARKMRSKLPKNFPEWGLAGSDIKAAQNAIKTAFKEEVRKRGKEVWFDLKDADIKYNSVSAVMKAGKAAAGKTLLSGWLPFGIVSNISSAATTTVGSIAGKLWYRLSEAATYLPEKLRQATKNLVKSGKLKDILKQNLRETPAMLLYPQAEKIKEWIENKAMTRLETAISTLESGKMPTRKQDPIIYALVKDMTKEEALEQLTQLKSVRWTNKKEFKDGLDYLLKIIETEAGDSFTPYMKKK